MASYITIQYPQANNKVFLQDKYSYLAKRLKVGDKVFFYETKTNKNKGQFRDNGKMGIVHVGIISGPPESRFAKTETNHGKKIWPIQIPTNAKINSCFVSHKKVVDILGYKDNYYFLGFGDGGASGLKRLLPSEAKQLENCINGY